MFIGRDLIGVLAAMLHQLHVFPRIPLLSVAFLSTSAGSIRGLRHAYHNAQSVMARVARTPISVSWS